MDDKKISSYQLYILLLMLMFSPAIRFIPSYVSVISKQASWISPIASHIIFILYIYLLYHIFKSSNNLSFCTIIENTIGIIAGRVLLFLYMIWITILIGLYARYFGERIVSFVFPNSDIRIFIALLLISIGIILHSGIRTIARIAELLFIYTSFLFLLFFILIMPEINLDYLTPISPLDIVPILKSIPGIAGIGGYIIILFFFNDKILDPENNIKSGLISFTFASFITTLLIIGCIGSMGYHVTSRVSTPYFISIKMISLFHTIEGIESITVTQWVFCDFILVSVFSYSFLSILSHILNSTNKLLFITPYIIIIYFITILISSTKFELEIFSTKFIIQCNWIFEFLIPLLILVIGKLRKKI